MLSVSWKTDALYDLVEIVDYVEQRNPAAAANLHADMVSVAESLPNHPYLYRRGRVPGTREAVVHPNYILVYLVGEKSLKYFTSFIRGSSSRFDQFQSYLCHYFDCSRRIYCLNSY